MIPAGVKFQISLPTPIAPTYNNMMPRDRPSGDRDVDDAHALVRSRQIAKALPHDRISLQWDVCQEVHRVGGLL